MHAVTCALEGELDVLGDLWQRGVVPGGKVEVLRWAVQDLMCSKRISPASSKPYRSKTGKPSSSTFK
jgi:hypothetical protein